MRVRPRYVGIGFRALALESVFHEENTVPCAVRTILRGQRILYAVNRNAERAGVRPGMTESEGKATSAELVVRDRDMGLELGTLERTAERLLAYGPELEIVPPHWALLEVARAATQTEEDEQTRLFRIRDDLRSMGHEVCLAVADDPDTAQTFARALVRRMLPEDMVLVPRRSARQALANLPISALAWTEQRRDPDRVLAQKLHEVCELSQNLGVETVDDFRRQSASEWISRFGQTGKLLAERATAASRRTLHPFIPPEKMEEPFELDAVTEDLEPILFVLRKLLHRLSLRLEARGQAAQSLVVTWILEPSEERSIDCNEARPSGKLTEIMVVKFARPTRNEQTMFSVLREKIGGSLPGAVLSIRLRAEQIELESGTQLDLFSRKAQRTEDLSELLGRLAASLGEHAIITPEIVNTHRPEASWQAKPFSIERAFEKFEPEVKRTLPKIAAIIPISRDLKNPLPKVTEDLSVIGTAEHEQTSKPVSNPASWPKPKQRKAEDEPLDSLPPRPTELLEPPEPARFPSSTTLQWRGQLLTIEKKTHGEVFQTEWWKPKVSDRLERSYNQLHLSDGRILWVFTRSDGAHFVHGIFD